MAPPGYCLRAHDATPCRTAERYQLVQGLGELRGLHIVGIAAEAGVSPSRIWGILTGMPEATKRLHVLIAYSDTCKRHPQPVLVELRIMPRTGDCPYIDQLDDLKALKHCDEAVDWERRMADGKDDAVVAQGISVLITM